MVSTMIRLRITRLSRGLPPLSHWLPPRKDVARTLARCIPGSAARMVRADEMKDALHTDEPPFRRLSRLKAGSQPGLAAPLRQQLLQPRARPHNGLVALGAGGNASRFHA